MGKFDVGAGFGGATSGASIGTMFGGPPGGAVGAASGALLGGFFGGSKKPKTKSSFDPEQRSLYGNLNQGIMGEGPLADLFNSNPELLRSFYDSNFAQPAMQQFQQQTVPTITGAFRGKGLGNSSYLGNALGQAGVDMQSGLNAQLAKLLYGSEQDTMNRRMKAIDSIMNSSHRTQQPPEKNAIGGFLREVLPKSLDYLFDKYNSNTTEKPSGLAGASWSSY